MPPALDPFAAISVDFITAAAARIAPHVRETPLWRLPGSTLGLPAGTPPCEVWLKLEHLQRSGSFKARGMFNRILSNPIPPAGVIAASGGNAGIATALAARALGVRAEVYVPSVISPAKRDKLAALGAHVVIAGDVYADALLACEARQRETGALLLHAYDQTEVVAGAGTLAREIEAQAGTPDTLLVSVGGGGLIAGIAAWFAGRCRVVGLEPELAPTLYRAREAGMPVDVAVSGIAADALGARRIGSIAWQVTQQHVAQAVLLDDAAIRTAQRFLWTELKLAVEPAAALQSGAIRPRAGETLCAIICGANLDVTTLA